MWQVRNSELPYLFGDQYIKQTIIPTPLKNLNKHQYFINMYSVNNLRQNSSSKEADYLYFLTLGEKSAQFLYIIVFYCFFGIFNWSSDIVIVWMNVGMSSSNQLISLTIYSKLIDQVGINVLSNIKMGRWGVMKPQCEIY